MILLNKIWFFLMPAQRRTAIVLLVLALIGTMLETIGLGLIVPLIGLMAKPDYFESYPTFLPVLELLGHPTHKRLFIIVLSAFLSVYVVKVAYVMFFVWYQTGFILKLKASVAGRLFYLYLNQPWSFYLQRNSAQLIQTVIKETNMLTRDGFAGVFNLFRDTSLIAAVLLLLLIAEPFATVVVVAFLGFFGWLYHRLSGIRVRKWGKQRQNFEKGRMKTVKQGLGIVKEIKLLNREDFFFDQFRALDEKLVRIGRLQSVTEQYARLVLELFIIVIFVLTITTMMLAGKEMAAMVPLLGLFAVVVIRLIPSVTKVMKALHGLRFVSPIVDTLHQELSYLEKPQNEHLGAPLSFNAKLELEQVTYSFSGADRPALEGMTLSLPVGSFVGVVGRSGVGKSTFINLILGLLTPDSGRISVDGIDIQTNLRCWQRQIGYVSQDILLIDDSLRRNIALGLPDDQIDEDRLWHAVEAAQLDGFVRAMPEQLNTMVGERGVRISGGECQRVGIARALYNNPSVLVLDEATSSLDLQTEAAVIDAINNLKGRKTIIMISHRLTAVKDCDVVYRMEQGKIIHPSNLSLT